MGTLSSDGEKRRRDCVKRMDLQRTYAVSALLGAVLLGTPSISLGQICPPISCADTPWGDAVLLENEPNRAENPKVAVDASGNAIAVWNQLQVQADLSTRWHVFANRYEPGTGWLGRVRISENAGAALELSHLSPDVAIAPNGDALVVWREEVGSGADGVWAKRFDVQTGTWIDVVQLDTQAVDQLEARVGFDGQGNAIAAWVRFGGPACTCTHVVAQRYVNGVWEPNVEQLDTVDETASPVLASDVALALDVAGNAVVVWSQSIQPPGGVLPPTSIWAARFDATLPVPQWGAPTVIDTEEDAGEAAVGPAVVLDETGNAYVVWSQMVIAGTTRSHIFFNRFDALTGLWNSTADIIDSEFGDAHAPDVSIDGDGNVFAVWFQEASDSIACNPAAGPLNIWANRFDVSVGAWQAAADQIECDYRMRTLDFADAPHIAADDLGNAIAVWVAVGPGGASNEIVVANRYRANVGWEPCESVRVSEVLTPPDSCGPLGGVDSDLDNPRIAVVRATGDAVVVWENPQNAAGFRKDIGANRLAGDPIPTVSEWGLIVMSLLILAGGTLVYERYRPTHT